MLFGSKRSRMWKGIRQKQRELRRSKESDTQFVKCDKLNEKCENEEETSVPDRKKGSEGNEAVRSEDERKVAQV